MDSSQRDDELLADAWARCSLARSISHEEHLRISFVLLRRYGSEEGSLRIIEGTRQNCEALEASDRYDDALTRRWAAALAEALEESADQDVASFLERHPQFRRGDLLGLPAWKFDSS